MLSEVIGTHPSAFKAILPHCIVAAVPATMGVAARAIDAMLAAAKLRPESFMREA
jgi:hypothetical protein